MPRKARIDAAGALHHIICRGIERRLVFREDFDRQDFVRRLGVILTEAQTPCFAWALMPNHFHLLLRTGNVPISSVMRRLLTGYAGSFNRRYRRHGHLFQNRYKSILCQEDAYLLELVRYIHLNPLRAKVVESINGLDDYEFCGHKIILGKIKNEWQDTETILGLFGHRVLEARKRYHAYIEEGNRLGRRPDLVGGGLIRSAGGWQTVKTLRRSRIHTRGDERILGDSDFVQQVLEGQNEKLEARCRLQARGIDFHRAAKLVEAIYGLRLEDLQRGDKRPNNVKARSVLCYWAVVEIGMSATEVARLLSVGQPAVSRSVKRGQKIVQEMNLQMV
jgi:putative transposase